MAEMEQFPGAVGLNGLAGIVGRRAHGVAAGRAGQVAGTSEGNRHAPTLAPVEGHFQAALHRNAYCVCTALLADAHSGQNPLTRLFTSRRCLPMFQT